MLAYGFEDMTGVQLAALRALAARCEVIVSMPYETGRARRWRPCAPPWPRSPRSRTS